MAVVAGVMEDDAAPATRIDDDERDARREEMEGEALGVHRPDRIEIELHGRWLPWTDQLSHQPGGQRLGGGGGSSPLAERLGNGGSQF